MTIQKLSSGSKKNCRFFCVCRDLAGLVGQNVLEDMRHEFEKKEDKHSNKMLIATFPYSVSGLL